MRSSIEADGACEGIDEEQEVHAWRVERLARLGLPRPVAEAVADEVDWHEVAKLIERGCPPALAVTIAARN
jgi:hypothetical protein